MAGYPPSYPPPPGPPFGADPREQRRFYRAQVKAYARAQKAAGQAQHTLYRQQTRGQRRSSMLGPVLVVAFGIVALLISIGRISFPVFAGWYGRWWPALLVVAGTLLVVEWTVDQALSRNAETGIRRGVGGGVVFLLLCLALGGAALHTVRDGRDIFLHGFSINPDNIDEFFGEKHEFQQAIDQPFAPGTSLSIDNPHGDVVIAGSTDGNVHIAVEKQVYVTSDSEAESKGNRLSPRVFLSGSVLNVSLPALDGGITNLTISLPSTAPTTVNANHGDITISGMHAPVSVTSNHGDIDVNSVTGSVSAHANHSGNSVSAHQVTGDVTIRGRAGDVNVSDVSGQVTFDGDFYGDTHLEHLGGPLTFTTSRTHFTLARLDGEVDINSSDLSGSQIVGPTQLRTRSRNVSFQRVAGDLDIVNSNGPVDVTSSAPLGVVLIQNSNGGVTLTVPGNTGLAVDADTRNGEIGNDFGLSSTQQNDRSVLHGTVVGAGSGRVSIHTTHADINLRSGVVEPPMPPSAGFPAPAPSTPGSVASNPAAPPQSATPPVTTAPTGKTGHPATLHRPASATPSASTRTTF